jgi:hypothetical protein
MPANDDRDVLLATRGTAHSRPDALDRGLSSGPHVTAGGLEEWARGPGYALDFLPEDRVAELAATQGRPYREASPYESRLRKRGYASDFTPHDSLGATQSDENDSAHAVGAAPKRHASSSVTANFSDPRLTARLQNGPGIRFVGSPSQNFAKPDTVRAIEAVGERWAALHPAGPRIRVGGIGIVYGGPLQRGSANGTPLFHKSHQVGIDADIRLMRSDGKEDDTDISSPEYSRQLTAFVIGLFFSQTVLPVDTIFFNDPLIPRVVKQVGHDNHFHVRFVR